MPKLPTEDGSNENVGIFGPAVNRRIDFGSRNNETAPKQKQSQFQHDTAIFVRYVDPSITAVKMLDIVKMNEVLKEALKNDPGAVEVTRLVKKSLTEDQITGFRNGVSYRIGCTESLFEALQAKSNWATHWQIRPWDNEYKNTENEIETSFNGLNSDETTTTHTNRE